MPSLHRTYFLSHPAATSINVQLYTIFLFLFCVLLQLLNAHEKIKKKEERREQKEIDHQIAAVGCGQLPAFFRFSKRMLTSQAVVKRTPKKCSECV